MVVFQPGIVGANPCPHMIYLLSDVITGAKEPNIESTYVWNHPWFQESDPDRFASELLWNDVFDYWAISAKERRTPGFSLLPSLPYRIRRPVREVRYPHHGDPGAH